MPPSHTYVLLLVLCSLLNNALSVSPQHQQYSEGSLFLTSWCRLAGLAYGTCDVHRHRVSLETRSHHGQNYCLGAYIPMSGQLRSRLPGLL